MIAEAYGSDAATRSCALAMRLVATSSIALVIFFVERVDRIRRRRTRTEPAIAYFFFGGVCDDPGDLLLRLHALAERFRLGLVQMQRSPSLPRKICLKCDDRLVEGGDDVVAPLVGGDRGEHSGVRVPQVLQELGLEPADVTDRDVVELALGAGPDRDDLLLHRVRRVVGLLEQLDQAGAALQLGA